MKIDFSNQHNKMNNRKKQGQNNSDLGNVLGIK